MLRLPSIKNYINVRELVNSWVASGLVSSLVAGVIAWLTYIAGNASSISENGVVAALITFVATKAATDLRNLASGKDLKVIEKP